MFVTSVLAAGVLTTSSAKPIESVEEAMNAEYSIVAILLNKVYDFDFKVVQQKKI